MYIFVCV